MYFSNITYGILYDFTKFYIKTQLICGEKNNKYYY